MSFIRDKCKPIVVLCQHMSIIKDKSFDKELIQMPQFNSPEMKETIRRVIRAQMVESSVSYKQLTERLNELGVHQTESTLRSKVNNASMGAQLFLYIQMALNIEALDINHVADVLKSVKS